jgi:hypothetical protein
MAKRKPATDRAAKRRIKKQSSKPADADTGVPWKWLADVGPPMRPEGADYMPLTQAAHWIASKGGTESIGSDEQLWKPAFDDLLARIASGEVAVIGRRGAGNESVPGHLFARIDVAYPYSDPEFGPLLRDDPYLDCYPFVDENDWQRESNDKLYASGREAPQWTHLQVRKSDIMHRWPFSPSALSVATTARDEAGAIAFLAEKLRSSGEELTRESAYTECSEKFKLSKNGFRFRVWPKARIEAGLPATAPSGRKRQTLPENR